MKYKVTLQNGESTFTVYFTLAELMLAIDPSCKNGSNFNCSICTLKDICIAISEYDLIGWLKSNNIYVYKV